MGANDPNYPTAVASSEAADAYLAGRLAAVRARTRNDKTGSPTLSAAEVIDAVTQISGGAAAGITLPSAANLITQMQAVDANAGVGSTFEWGLVNDNTGAITLTLGANTTFVTAPGTVPAAAAWKFIVKWATATTVTLARTA